MLVPIEPPDTDPVTLAEIKTRFDIDYDDHDTFLRSAIKAATAWVENRTARALIEQTWELRIEEFEDRIEIPKRPTLDIVSITYIDASGDEREIEEEDYLFIDGGPNNASVVMPVDAWPTDIYARPDAVRIRFKAGYNDDIGVPEDLKEAIRSLAGHYYENREAVLLSPVRQELQVTPLGLDSLVAPYIVPRL